MRPSFKDIDKVMTAQKVKEEGLTKEEIDWIKLLLDEDIVRLKNALRYKVENKNSFKHTVKEIIKRDTNIKEKLDKLSKAKEKL